MAGLENGRAYSHSQIVFGVGGVPMISMSGMRWSKKQIKGFNYGTGQLPVSFGTGNHEPVEFVFTISKNDYELLRDASVDQDIRNILPFDILITFTNQQRVVTDVVKNVLILGDDGGSETGNTDIKYEIGTIATDVERK